MSLFSFIGAAVLACLLTGVGAFVKGNSHGKAVVQAEWEAQKVKDRAAVDAANLAANQAAVRYEEARNAVRTRTIVVTKEVTRALETAPAWRDAVVPDGVQRSLAAAASDAAASQPDRGLPAAAGASAPDERGSGPGLRFGAGWLGRLSSSASGPR